MKDLIESAAKVNLAKAFNHTPEVLIGSKIGFLVETGASNSEIVIYLENQASKGVREMESSREWFNKYAEAKAQNLHNDWHTMRGQSLRGIVADYAFAWEQLKTARALIHYFK